MSYVKPLPVVTEESAPFWAAAARHRLVVQWCPACGRHQLPPVHACPACNGPLEWRQATGRGTLHTFTVLHDLYHPGFADELPYNVSVVELEEGPLLLSNVVGCPNRALRIGMPLVVVFDDVTPEVTLPRFRPSAPAGAEPRR